GEKKKKKKKKKDKQQKIQQIKRQHQQAENKLKAAMATMNKQYDLARGCAQKAKQVDASLQPRRKTTEGTGAGADSSSWLPKIKWLGFGDIEDEKVYLKAKQLEEMYKKSVDDMNLELQQFLHFQQRLKQDCQYLEIDRVNFSAQHFTQFLRQHMQLRLQKNKNKIKTLQEQLEKELNELEGEKELDAFIRFTYACVSMSFFFFTFYLFKKKK
ncbi:hypothetical protein RFI_12573, partial [Reticulomyxa filosa]